MSAYEKFDAVVEDLVEQINNSEVPWIKPWETYQMWIPTNFISKKQYKGISRLLLDISVNNRFAYWCTFSQAKAIGAHIKKNEKATTTFYYYPIKEEKIVDGKKEEHIKSFRFRVSHLFNSTQLEFKEGTPEIIKEQMFQTTKKTPFNHEGIEKMLQNSKANVIQTSDRAFYSPSDDFIGMPPKEAFKSDSAYYPTLLHELSHWSGHPSRLKRDMSGRFADESYAKEELIAEIGSYFLSQHFGLRMHELQHAEYLKSWGKLLSQMQKEEVSRFIYKSVSQSQKIYDFFQKFMQCEDFPLEMECSA